MSMSSADRRDPAELHQAPRRGRSPSRGAVGPSRSRSRSPSPSPSPSRSRVISAAGRFGRRLGYQLTACVSTMPDAVGVTGIRYIISSNYPRIRRLLWAIALIIGMGSAFNQIGERLRYFGSNPKRVDVHVQYKASLDFPAITVCNHNNFMNVEGKLQNHAFGQLLSAISGVESLSGSPIPRVIALADRLGGANTTALFLDYAHPMGQDGGMLIKGFWDGSGRVEAANFTQVITDFGVCYTFNAGLPGPTPLRQRVAGRGHGLTLVLDVQEENYYYSLNRLRWSSGMLVAVHDPDDLPAVNSRAVGVITGTECRIGVRAKRTNNLAPPLGDCGSRELKYFRGYTVHKCQRECLIDFFLQTCGCVEPYMTVAEHARVCDPVESFYCTLETSGVQGILVGCDCPVPCTSLTYSTSLSSTRFPADFHEKEFKRSISAPAADLSNHSSDSLVMIQIFFEELVVDEFTQQTDYALFALMCDVGGAIGLWLGGSVLTVVEIVDHLATSTIRRGPSASER